MMSMSQVLQTPPLRLCEAEFSVGICAADRPTGVNQLLELIDGEQYPPGCVLREVIIVASGLDRDSLSVLRDSVRHREQVVLIEETTRKGKAEALNRIIDTFTGEYLVLINSDAVPAHGAISILLDNISRDDEVGMISASPIIEDGAGVTGAVLKLMWHVHNQCLSSLNKEAENNHCCDELIVIRSEAVRTLPDDAINDGAYLAGAAYRAGYTVEFCEDAKVKIDVPASFIGLMKQRRRILFGHMQIQRSLGESPRTLESMLFTDPGRSLSILVRTFAEYPGLFLALPVAVVAEFFSATYAVIDTLAKKKHVPWDRVGRRG